jgi:hypothetical protein
MNRTRPELALERLLFEFERDVLHATDEELLSAARELGMNPAMRGSAALSGVITPPRFVLPGKGERKSGGGRPRRKRTYVGREACVTDGKPITREQVLSWLTALTPEEAKTLRTRFGIDSPERSHDEEELLLHALARELATLHKKN